MPEQNYAVATVPLTTPRDRWADGKRRLGARILTLGLRRGPWRVLGGILCVEAGNEPTGALAQGHTVAGRLWFWYENRRKLSSGGQRF